MTPPGFSYHADFLTEDEEAALLSHIAAVQFAPFEMKGQVARRQVAHYGYGYAFGAEPGLRAAPPIPDFLLALRERAAPLAERAPEALDEALVTWYPPGAGIGWHRDAPGFGSRVVGVSLLGPCRMRFQRVTRDGRDLYVAAMAPRSAYVLAGAARWQWQHQIPPVKQTRYSITFRSARL